MKIPFGTVVTSYGMRDKMLDALHHGQFTEGKYVAEFEREFARKFGWRHAVATSSGTTAGEVAWSAAREIQNVSHYSESMTKGDSAGHILTPACAFAATANCILAAGMRPIFIDVKLETLNMDAFTAEEVKKQYKHELLRVIGAQFVMTMGHSKGLRCAWQPLNDVEYYIVDACEGHGGSYRGKDTPHYSGAKAAIYSLYPAHLVVGVEGGVICMDDDQLADLCRSIKSHGRPAWSNYFDFQRVGYNAKWSELHAIVALESLAGFDDRFAKRRWVRERLLDALSRFEEDLILYRDEPGEIISPHAFPVVLRDPGADVMPLYKYLEVNGVEVKTLFGSLPTQHKAFAFLGHTPGEFPVAERIGRTGLHFGCGEFMEQEDVDYVAGLFEKHFSRR